MFSCFRMILPFYKDTNNGFLDTIYLQIFVSVFDGHELWQSDLGELCLETISDFPQFVNANIAVESPELFLLPT